MKVHYQLTGKWKLAKVIPIHKKGVKNKVENYRPISLLVPCSKVFEGIVDDSLDLFLESNNLLSRNQFGFRKNRSTVAQLLDTVNEWTSVIDSGKLVDSIYIDIRKAFDSVSHAKLLQTLSAVGVSGKLLRWFSA